MKDEKFLATKLDSIFLRAWMLFVNLPRIQRNEGTGYRRYPMEDQDKNQQNFKKDHGLA